MHKYRLSALLFLLLAGCQGDPVDRDYDLQRDYQAYRTWQWHAEPIRYLPAEDPRLVSDLTTRRIRTTLRELLPARGLQAAEPADLSVQVWVIRERHQQQVTSYQDWGPWWGGYWGGGGSTSVETRTDEYQTRTLQVDLRDTRSDQLVWRGSRTLRISRRAQSPTQRLQQIRQQLGEILQHYPPR